MMKRCETGDSEVLSMEMEFVEGRIENVLLSIE